MKKKRLYSRLGGTVLAVLMVLSMCLAPLSSLKAEAASFIDDSVSIAATTEGPVTIEADGEPVDLSSYFTLYYNNGEEVIIPYLAYDYTSAAFYTGLDDEEWLAEFSPYSAMFAMSYYDSEGNLLEAAPSEPGEYTVTAGMTATFLVYTDTAYDYSDSGYVQATTSEPLAFTITGKEDPGTVADDGVVWFKAVNGTEMTFDEGAEIDLTEDFVLYWNDDPLTFMQDRYYNSYYSKDVEDRPEGSLLMEDAYTVCYYDSDGNELAGAPTEAGTYTAKAKLTSCGSYYWAELMNWYFSKNVTSEVITITIGDGKSVADGGTIKYSGGVQTYTAGDEIDMSSYFTLFYNGIEAASVKDEEGNLYYADYSELLKIQWYDSDGQLMESAPEEEGVYSVSAKLEKAVTAYDDENNELGSIDAMESRLYRVTVEAASSTNIADAPLEIAFTGNTTKIEATGEPVDFSDDFTFMYKGAELVLIFQGYRDEDNNWIWGTGTYKDYRNFSDIYAGTDDEYEPYKNMYTVHYWDADGNELESAPSEPGSYYVSADVPDISDENGSYCLYTKYAYADETHQVVTEDEHYFYYDGAASEMIAFTITEAGSEQPTDGVVWFKAVNGTEMTFDEGAEIDLTEDFVLYWNDDPLTFMQDRNYTSYYSKDTAPEGALTMEDAYTVSYYDANGSELAGAPSKAGTYTAKAALTSSDVYYWTGLYNWYKSVNVTSEEITIIIGDGVDASNVGAAIKFKGGEQTYTEGDEIDLSSCFSVYYDGKEVYALYDYNAGVYYYADAEPAIGELLVYNFYDEEGTLLDGVPETAGVYAVSASLPEGYFYAYADEEWTEIGYIYPDESEKYKLTINAASSGSTSLTEGLHINFIGDTTEFVANGEPVDFSDAFTFELYGVEPVIIFSGYKDENNNWIWGTGTDKDYVNYSNVFDGYVLFKELYVVHYWDEDGNELESAPSEPGNYYVSADMADITDDGGCRCIYTEYGYDEETYEITADVHYFYYGGAASEMIPFVIKDAGASGGTDEPGTDEPGTDEPGTDEPGTDEPGTKPQGEPVPIPDENNTGKTADDGQSAKTGDTTPIALYIVLIAACGVAVAVMIQRRRRNG